MEVWDLQRHSDHNLELFHTHNDGNAMDMKASCLDGVKRMDS